MLISVTIPVFNDPEGLHKTLCSLQKQSYINWEAIVVDDGSYESVESVVQSFGDPRIIFFRFETNKGRPTARQKTFELMKGDLCGFLDAGDSYKEDFLSNAIGCFEKFDLLLGVSQSMTIIYKGIQYQNSYVNGSVSLLDEEYLKLSFASTIFRSYVCKDYQFNTKLKYSQDRHFLDYISLNFNGKIFLLNSHSYIYDQGNNMSVKTTAKKYYYSIVRFYQEKKIKKCIYTLPKLFIFTFIHMVCGFEKVLQIRFTRLHDS